MGASQNGILIRDYSFLINSFGAEAAFREFSGDIKVGNGWSEAEVSLGFLDCGNKPVSVETLESPVTEASYKDILRRVSLRNTLILQWQEHGIQVSDRAQPIVVVKRKGKNVDIFIIPPSPN